MGEVWNMWGKGGCGNGRWGGGMIVLNGETMCGLYGDEWCVCVSVL